MIWIFNTSFFLGNSQLMLKHWLRYDLPETITLNPLCCSNVTQLCNLLLLFLPPTLISWGKSISDPRETMNSEQVISHSGNKRDIIRSKLIINAFQREDFDQKWEIMTYLRWFKNKNGVTMFQASKMESGGHCGCGFRYVPSSLRNWNFFELYQTQGHHQLFSKQIC